MTPTAFGVSRSKVKVTGIFKLKGAYMFHKHFLLNRKSCGYSSWLLSEKLVMTGKLSYPGMLVRLIDLGRKEPKIC